MNITEQITELTRRLVQTPSQNGIDSEAAVAKIVSEHLSSFGFHPEQVGPSDHPSIICTIDRGEGKTVWLESCLDTVSSGDEAKWSFPPFGAHIEGDRMFGRGVADCKVGVSLFCYLAKALSEDSAFQGKLFLGFDAEEQGGQFTGVQEVLKHAPEADICILGYQGDREISIGARGWLRLKLTTRGESSHTGSRSQRGVNAIHQMVRALSTLQDLDLQKVEPYFEFGSSFHVAQIGGGVAINIVPDRCEVSIDIRLVPSQTKESVVEEIKAALGRLSGSDDSFRYELEELQSEQAYLTDPSDSFVRVLQEEAEKVLERKVPLVASGQGSVGNVISQRGVPIINAFGCESDNVHAPDEWVNLGSIPRTFEIYRQAILKFAQS